MPPTAPRGSLAEQADPPRAEQDSLSVLVAGQSGRQDGSEAAARLEARAAARAERLTWARCAAATAPATAAGAAPPSGRARADPSVSLCARRLVGVQECPALSPVGSRPPGLGAGAKPALPTRTGLVPQGLLRNSAAPRGARGSSGPRPKLFLFLQESCRDSAPNRCRHSSLLRGEREVTAFQAFPHLDLSFPANPVVVQWISQVPPFSTSGTAAGVRLPCPPLLPDFVQTPVH